MQLLSSKEVMVRALKRLRELQGLDGSFSSYSSPTLRPFASVKKRETTFFTSTVLLALQAVPSQVDRDALGEKGVNFLLQQRSERWSWNYWKRESTATKSIPYPDDMDDTACALAALAAWKSAALNGNALASVTKTLTALEVTPGGPYITWLVSRDAAEVWRDIDVAVNANIAYFLKAQDIVLPGLNQFLEEALSKGLVQSPYYPSSFPVLYFLSRGYAGEARNYIQKNLLATQGESGHWGDPFHTALAVSALIYSGYDPALLHEAGRYLRATFATNRWQAYPWCLDPSEEGVKQYAGSEAVTIACCLEALSLLEPKEHELLPHPLQERVQVYMEQRLVVLKPGLRASILPVMQKIVLMNVRLPILTLPAVTQKALGKVAEKVPDSLLIELGAATAWGWAAYTLFDDFLDGAGEPIYLPAAIWAEREMVRIFSQSFPVQSRFHSEMQGILDALDAANQWEQEQCRFVAGESLRLTKENIPNYGELDILAERSLGHVLPVIALLYSTQGQKASSTARQMIRFFHHFFIARQLNDDAHDWEEDLRAGHINAVAAAMFVATGEVEGRVEEIIEQYQVIFWTTTIEQVAQQIRSHLKKAEVILKKAEWLEDPEPFRSMVDPLYRSMEKALHEREQTLQFIKQYKKKS